MGCALSKNNRVSPAEMTRCAKRGPLTNFKLWVGKKRCALFQQKVRRNQVMPLNPSPEDCHPISSESSGTASCHTPSTTSLSSSSSSWTTATSSELSDVSDSDEVQIAEESASNDRCRTRTIKKGSGSYHSDDARSKSSEESYHGNFEDREISPILFSSPRGSPSNLPMMITSEEGIELNDDEAERLLMIAEAEKREMERRQHLAWDSDDDDERRVNLDGILTVTPIRPPPTPAQREVASRDGGKALTGMEKSGCIEEEGEEEEPKYANSTEELEAVINKTFKTYNLKMPDEEEKLEEKTYDDPDEELGDVIQQIFRRWNIQMPDEEEEMPSTSRGAGVTPNRASTSRGSTSALTQPPPSNNGRHTATTEATPPSRTRQARPKAAHGARTDPTGRGFELPGSAFQRKY